MTTGSQWRKWDLHVHTPMSVCQKFGKDDDDETWNKYISDLEDLSDDFAVIGINDYLFIDGYKRLKKEQKENNKLQKLKLLPVLEFRIEKFAGVQFDKLKRINLHIIFSDELTTEIITSQFLNTLHQHYTLEDGKEWHRAITYESVKELGAEIKLGVPVAELSKYDSDLVEGFNNLNINEEQIFKALKKDCFKGKFLTAIGKTEWAELKWSDSSIATKKTIINQADIVFTAAESVESFNKAKKQLTAQGVKDLLLDCSDAHDFSTSADKDRIGNCLTWIKADPTFEGLKQICFEPSYRIRIAETAPIKPPIRINKTSFNFPTDAHFENEVFCFAGKKEIALSPNFTCFIGGRGTGKSTILNLIHEKLKQGENKFFREKKITDGAGKQVEIRQSINIDNDADEKYIEFLSQNEIEEYALDYKKLTSSVYSRITKLDEDGTIKTNEEELKNQLSKLNDHIQNKLKIVNLESDLTQRQKEQGTSKKIIESFSSDEYLEINKEMKSITIALQGINNSSETYRNLLDKIDEITRKYGETEENNIYDKQVNAIVNGIRDLAKAAKEGDYSKIEIKKTVLEQQLKDKKEELKKYLADKGLTEDNQKDITNANATISQLDHEISTKENEIAELHEEINHFDLEKVKQAQRTHKDELTKQIRKTSKTLETIDNTSVKPISLHFEFDTESALLEIFSDFKIAFENDITNSSHQDNKLQEILFCIPPDEVKDKDSFLEKINGYKTSSAAKGFLLELFNKDSNFDIYKLVIELTLLDYAQFKKVKVQYDGRPIESSSFGQRCTAVLVILLLLGNNPIIIDEPEAHLDSLLISNYLVEVIKKRKQNRQIIFATHNANFVINGDAELIHILTIDDVTKTTLLTSTTIENPETREILIGLEGGREAFRKREYRYQ